ncbi:MAG: zinc-binding dehydrogenase [Rhizobiaceae bacterium]|nr:zinc-binding dehydrogenase [Rhizobiaceae bacterium]
MRASVLKQPDGQRGSIVVEELPDPKPGKDEVVVSVAYAGCNYADTMMRRGIYPHPKGYPLAAGIELSGTVYSVGEGVTHLKPGDRVAAFCEEAGAFAELCLIDKKRLVKIPDAMGFDVAAAFFVQGLTAWHLLHTVSTTRPGDVLLVHAIGGGVGLYLTQLAVAAGATVLGTVGTPGKEKRPLEWGASAVALRQQQDFCEMVHACTEGRGVDKVLDSTGASILDRSFDCIRTLGHVVSYGEAEGKPYPNLWEQLVRKSLTFSRLHIGHIDCNSDAWRNGAQKVMELIGSGLVRVPIEGVYDLEDAYDMYERLESRSVAGKLLMRIAS